MLFLAASILLAIWAIGVIAAWAVLTRVEDEPEDPTLPRNRTLALLWPVVLGGAVFDICFPEPYTVERESPDTWIIRDVEEYHVDDAARHTGWTHAQLRALPVGESRKVNNPPRVPLPYDAIDCPKCGKRDAMLDPKKNIAQCCVCGNSWVA
jgi:hypothetical protein